MKRGGAEVRRKGKGEEASQAGGRQTKRKRDRGMIRKYMTRKSLSKGEEVMENKNRREKDRVNGTIIQEE